MKAFNYRSDIDGVRALAVLMVVFYHAFPSVLPSGFIGVDVFFVISGYLITGIISNGLNEGRFSFVDFYVRRIKRLAPSLLVVLMATLLIGWFVLMPEEYRQLGKHTIASVLFVINFLLSREVDYFDRSAEENPLLHLWSLGVEEQYYLVWPVLAFLAFKLRMRVHTVVYIVSALSFLLAVIFSKSNPEMTFFLPIFRAWEFGLGGLLALYAQKEISPYSDFNAVLGAFFILTAALTVSETSSHLSLWMALPVLGTCFIIGAGPTAWLNRRLLSNKMFVFVGLISYPLYLWHWPLLSLMNLTEGGFQSVTLRSLAIVLAFVLAIVTWKFVEQPLRYSRLSGSFVALLASFVVLGTVSLFIYRDGGVPSRLSHQVVQSNDQLQWPMELRSAPACLRKYPGVRLSFCLESGPATASRVAIIGDSYANQYYYGLSSIFASRGQQLINLGHHSCAPVWGVAEFRPEKDCSSMNAILKSVITDPSITTVVLASAWSGTESYVGDASVERFSRSLSKTIDDLESANKKVYIIGSVPLHLSKPSVCTLRPFRLADYSEACSIDRALVNKRLLKERNMISGVLKSFPNVVRVSPVDILCDKTTCPLTESGTLLYRDGHLSTFGSNFLARNIINLF